jgi:hypothetical protein
LADLDVLFGSKYEDDMRLRPISRPNYQGDDSVHLDDDDEYDPVVEEAAEQRREIQREGRQTPVGNAIHPTSRHVKQTLLTCQPMENEPNH